MDRLYVLLSDYTSARQLRSACHLPSQTTDNTVFISSHPSAQPLLNSLPLTACLISTICQHLHTTPQDLSVLLSRSLSPTNKPYHPSTPAIPILFDVWRATKMLLT